MDIFRNLQLTETDMLKQLDYVCKTHDIPYFIMWGTALGAKRHHGFIPWDDDIDVGMMREDYNRLKQIPKEEWNGLQLIDGETECFYHDKVFPRLYKPGTVFETEQWVKYTNNADGIKKPVWIDIFLYDYTESIDEARAIAEKARRIHTLFYYSKYRTNIVASDSLMLKLKCIAKNILHRIISVRKPEQYLSDYYNTVRKNKGKYIISYDSWTMNDIMASFAEYDDVFPTSSIKFEGMYVSAPHDIHKHLSKAYGDYMTLPPEQDRVGHVPFNIEL